MAWPCYARRKFLHLVYLAVKEALNNFYSQIFSRDKSVFLTLPDHNRFHFNAE